MFGEEGGTQDGIDPGAGAGYDPSQGQQGGTGDQGPGGHPAFQEIYSVLPQEFHEKVSPVLKQWEQNVNNRFEQVHSKYGAWDPFIKQGVDPEQVGWAVNMLNMLEQNPREVYDRIGQYYQFNGPAAQQQQDPANGQGQQNQQVQNDDPYTERFTATERQLRLMTDYLVQQREQQAQAEADRWLDEQMAAAEKKYGKFDEKFVAAQMAGGLTIDQAVQAFQQLRQQWGAPPPPPLITGAGGGIANMNTDVRKMNDQDTHNLAVQMVQSAFRQNAG